MHNVITDITLLYITFIGLHLSLHLGYFFLIDS